MDYLEIEKIHKRWSSVFKHDDYNLSLVLERQIKINDEEIFDPIFMRMSIPLAFRVMSIFKSNGSCEKLNSFYTFNISANYENWCKNKNLGPLVIDNEANFCLEIAEGIVEELKENFTNDIFISGFYFKNDKVTMNYERT